MATRRLGCPISKKSETEIRALIADWKANFDEWDLDDLEIVNKDVDGQQVPHLVLVLKG